MTTTPPIPRRLPLGLRPSLGKPTLKVGSFLRAPAALPQVPSSADHLTGETWDMGRNDQYSTCGPTSLANYVRMVSARLSGEQRNPSWDDIVTLYRRQNPAFDEQDPGGVGDQGVEMATMLADAVKYGFGSTKVLGFAEVDVTDPAEVAAAIAIFGGVLTGVELRYAQLQDQLDAGYWRLVPASPVIGGHAVMEGAYDPTMEECVTWAERVKMAPDFLAAQRWQSFVVILSDHLGDGRFLENFDLNAFATAYEQITGRPFPVTIAPTPPTPPAPGTDPAGDSLAAVAAPWASKRRCRAENRRLKHAIKAWLKATGRA